MTKLNELAPRPGSHKARMRIGRSATLEDTPSVRGMIAKVAHMVEVKEEA